MGLTREWQCQRCGTLATMGLSGFLQNCKTCRMNVYLSHKTTGVGVDISSNKPRGSSIDYCSARIFHEDSKDTPFEIDTANASMRVNIRDDGSGLLHGMQTFKLLKSSVRKLQHQLGRGLVGTVAKAVSRHNPETVFVYAADGGMMIEIENPQFAVRYTDDLNELRVSSNLPRCVENGLVVPVPQRKRTIEDFQMGAASPNVETVNVTTTDPFVTELVTVTERRDVRDVTENGIRRLSVRMVLA